MTEGARIVQLSRNNCSNNLQSGNSVSSLQGKSLHKNESAVSVLLEEHKSSSLRLASLSKDVPKDLI